MGVYVPSETIEDGLRYVRPAWNERHAGFSYQPGGEGSWGGGFNITAAGVLSLQLAGEYEAPEVAAGLRSALTQYFQNNRGDDHFFYYGRYYLAQCVYQAQSKMPWGIRAWNTFYPAMAEELLHRQMASGCWHDLNDEYGTAQSLLIVAIPKRLLPIYQR